MGLVILIMLLIGVVRVVLVMVVVMLLDVIGWMLVGESLIVLLLVVVFDCGEVVKVLCLCVWSRVMSLELIRLVFLIIIIFMMRFFGFS